MDIRQPSTVIMKHKPTCCLRPRIVAARLVEGEQLVFVSTSGADNITTCLLAVVERFKAIFVALNSETFCMAPSRAENPLYQTSTILEIDTRSSIGRVEEATLVEGAGSNVDRLEATLGARLDS